MQPYTVPYVYTVRICSHVYIHRPWTLYSTRKNLYRIKCDEREEDSSSYCNRDMRDKQTNAIDVVATLSPNQESEDMDSAPPYFSNISNFRIKLAIEKVKQENTILCEAPSYRSYRIGENT